MPADLGKIKSMIVEGSVSDDTLRQAVEDATRLLWHYGVEANDCDYDLKLRLLVAHVLYQWGFSRAIMSKSVGDVSVSFTPLDATVGAGGSPYLQTFFGLLKSSDFILSP